MSDEFRPECEDSVQWHIADINDYARRHNRSPLTKAEEQTIRLQYYMNQDADKQRLADAIKAEKRQAETREKGGILLFETFGRPEIITWKDGLTESHREAYRQIFDKIKRLIEND